MQRLVPNWEREVTEVICCRSQPHADSRSNLYSRANEISSDGKCTMIRLMNEWEILLGMRCDACSDLELSICAALMNRLNRLHSVLKKLGCRVEPAFRPASESFILILPSGLQAARDLHFGLLPQTLQPADPLSYRPIPRSQPCPKSCVGGQARSAMAASTISSTCGDSFRWVIGQGTTCQDGSRVSQRRTSWIAPAHSSNPPCALPNL
jgi:hypothetical protein